MTATSGRQCIAPSMKSSPLGLWLKTLLESSRWSSRARFLRWQAQPLFSTRRTTFEDDTNCERPLPCNASAQTLKVTDMPSSRCLFRLVPSEPPTDETGCSSSQGELLPTPIAWDGEKGGARKVNGKTTDTTHKYSTSLKDRAAAGLLPTPVSQGLKVCDKNGKTRFIDLSLLPTPTAGEALKWRNQLDFGSQMGMALNALAVNGLLPTPMALEVHKERTQRALDQGQTTFRGRPDEGKDTHPSGIMDYLQFMGVLDKAEEYLDAIAGNGLKTGRGSRLNPLYTEEMMGFPLIWTALPFLSESGAQKPSKPTATR